MTWPQGFGDDMMPLVTVQHDLALRGDLYNVVVF